MEGQPSISETPLHGIAAEDRSASVDMELDGDRKSVLRNQLQLEQSRVDQTAEKAFRRLSEQTAKFMDEV